MTHDWYSDVEDRPPPDHKAAIWKSVNWESCEDCGDAVEVYTKCGGDLVYDGDEIICVGCGRIGQMSADEDAYAMWDDNDSPIRTKT